MPNSRPVPPFADRSIDIQGTHAGPWAPHAGADCPHPMNPCPRGAPGPTRRARAACAATAGFCARFAALGPILGAGLGPGAQQAPWAVAQGPPNHLIHPTMPLGGKFGQFGKPAHQFAASWLAPLFGGPKMALLPKKSTATREQTWPNTLKQSHGLPQAKLRGWGQSAK